MHDITEAFQGPANVAHAIRNLVTECDEASKQAAIRCLALLRENISVSEHIDHDDVVNAIEAIEKEFGLEE